MAGALSRVRRYQSDGDVDEENDDRLGYVPDIDGGDEGETGPLSLAPPGGESGPDASDWLTRVASSSGVGSPEQLGAALTRQVGSFDSAKQRQLALIRQARDRIPDYGPSDVGLAMASGMGGPLAPAFGAALNQLGRERAYNLQRGQDLGRFDLAEGTADVQGANADYGFLKDKLTIGREAAAAALRNKAYHDMIEQRRQAAAAYASERAQRDSDAQQAREDRIAEQRREADQRAEFSNYIGNDKETGLPIFANRLGQTRLGERVIEPKPGVGGRQSVYETRIADQMHATGLSRDEVVRRMNQKGLTATEYDRQIGIEKAQLRQYGKPNNTGQYQAWGSEDELNRQAEANVARRIADSLKATGTPLPLTQSAPQLYNSPNPAAAAPSAARAGQTAPAAPPAAPATRAAPPPSPSANGKLPAGMTEAMAMQSAKSAMARATTEEQRNAIRARVRGWGLDDKGL